MIKEKYRLIMLFDFYGKLLTSNQKEVLDMYCNYDMSLGEIAELLDNSRQAVYDSVKRSEKKLEKFEEKLMLIFKFKKIKKYTLEIKKITKKIETDKEKNDLTNIVKKIEKIY